MSVPEITVLPGIVYWFPGYEPKKLEGRCPHVCNHGSQIVVAWGPTWDTYEQVECRFCKCRGWRMPHQQAEYRMVA